MEIYTSKKFSKPFETRNYSKINNAHIPMKANTTERISFFVGLLLPKKQIKVETMITPPVTRGYCMDASRCIKAITNKKLAILSMAPFAAPTVKALNVYLGSFFFLNIISNETPEITAVKIAIQTE